MKKITGKLRTQALLKQRVGITRALMTGGTGFAGSHIVEALLERGDQVSAVDNLDSRVHDNKHHNQENVDGI